MFHAGLLLIVLGMLGLFFQGMTLILHRQLADLPIDVEEDYPKTVWVPPFAAAGVMIIGMMLLTIQRL